MNDLSKTPAAELVGEYTEIEKSRASAIKLRYAMAKERHERRDLIAQELDRRCEAAGIFIKDGSFGYYSANVHWDYHADNEYKFLNIPATEQHALEGWLLMKGGQGK